MTLKTQNLIILGITGLGVIIAFLPLFLPSEIIEKISDKTALPFLQALHASPEKESPPSLSIPSLSETKRDRGRDPFSLPSHLRMASEATGEGGATPVGEKDQDI